MSTAPNWPVTDVDKLRAFWKQGLTCGQIRSEFNGKYTRNAISGKADRLGLASRGSPIGSVRATKPPRVETESKRRGRKVVNPVGNLSVPRAEPKPLPAPVVIAAASLAIAFPALQRGQCQFATSPHNASFQDHKFCGHPVAPSRPFCPAHCNLSYSAPKA